MTDPTPDDHSHDRAEQAFRDAFAQQADRLEPVTPDPLVVRRRRWPALLAAAAALVLVGGIGALAMTGGTSSDSVPVAGDPSAPADDGSLPAPDDGWRWVSYRGVAVQVPEAWDYGFPATDQWCISSGPESDPQPFVAVEPSSQAQTDVGCFAEKSDAPAEFGPAPERFWVPYLSIETPFPSESGEATSTSASFDGWSYRSKLVDGVRVALTTDEATTPLADRILGSIRTFTVDQVGCDATSPVQQNADQRPTPGFDATTLTEVDAASVCQYARDGSASPGLIGSRALTQDEVATLLAGLRTAPAGGGPDHPSHCAADSHSDTGVVVRLTSGGATHDLYAYAGNCVGNGIDDGTTVRELTRDTCSPLFAEPPVALTYGDEEVFTRCVTPQHSYR